MQSPRSRWRWIRRTTQVVSALAGLVPAYPAAAAVAAQPWGIPVVFGSVALVALVALLCGRFGR